MRRCLADLYEVDRGVPYRYFAKIACVTVDELAAGTNAVAFASSGAVRFEAETPVVARVLSPMAVASGWVNREIRFMLNARFGDVPVLLIPALAEQCETVAVSAVRLCAGNAAGLPVGGAWCCCVSHVC